MHLNCRNVNQAFHELVSMMSSNHGRAGAVRAYGLDPEVIEFNTVSRPSRNGNVLMIDEPVTITYSHPRERVLFNQARDVNPFSVLYESLYMLTGRNDVAPLAYYTKKFQDFSDDGKTLNGAYGYRWRHSTKTVVEEIHPGEWAPGLEDVDQLDVIVNHLKADPNSRRAVLQMWNVEDDLLKIGRKEYAGEPTIPGSADVCCNLSVMFSLREEGVSTIGMTKDQRDEIGHDPCRRVLNMTVTNRSNDMIWGMLGANYVTFSVLQEYMAARLGVEVGRYHHFTNNLHVYDWNWKPEEWLADDTLDIYFRDTQPCKTVSLVKDPEAFERELPTIVSIFDGTKQDQRGGYAYPTEPFFADVAWPMFSAHYAYKRAKSADTIRQKLKEMELAFEFAEQIADDAWRTCCVNWLTRRNKPTA